MIRRVSHTPRLVWFSPWIIIGSVCILAMILAVLAWRSHHREKELMSRTLLSQANVLVRSLEAGSRTGMAGMGWGRGQLQTLLEETAQQPDVLYVGVVSTSGLVLAHSEPTLVGKTVSIQVPVRGESAQRYLEGDSASFEVTRFFQPWHQGRGRGGHAGAGACSISGSERLDRELLMVVGLDPTPFNHSRTEDLQRTLLLFGLMLLVGGGGFVSLVYAHHYRSARGSLRDMHALTATIENQMPVGLLVTNTDGAISRSNEAACRILGQTKLQGNIGQFPGLAPVVQGLQQDEIVVEREITCTIDGAPIPLLVNAAVLRDGSGSPAGHVLMLADISNLKLLEEQLRRSERLASLGRLAAGIAHEIRNPLSSIKGFATILGGRFQEDDRSKRIAEVMVQEVERLNRVVTELLDYAKPTELHKETVSCADIIHRTLELMEGAAENQGVAIQTRILPQDLAVDVDADRFSRALLNLYLNALQSMGRGGVLRVAADCREGEVHFTVADSGTGIAPENVPHVFDPYFTTKPNGVGLGLANVYKIIEAHNGQIEVVSTLGDGTTFRILLPHSCSIGSGIDDGQKQPKKVKDSVSAGWSG
ncbi:MAG: ATP-binding protein [Syntrophobacteraceae bacterium]